MELILGNNSNFLWNINLLFQVRIFSQGEVYSFNSIQISPNTNPPIFLKGNHPKWTMKYYDFERNVDIPLPKCKCTYIVKKILFLIFSKANAIFLGFLIFNSNKVLFFCMYINHGKKLFLLWENPHIFGILAIFPTISPTIYMTIYLRDFLYFSWCETRGPNCNSIYHNRYLFITTKIRYQKLHVKVFINSIQHTSKKSISNGFCIIRSR